MTSIMSPFDTVHTSIVSPRFAKNFSVYLYKPDNAVATQPYTIKVRPMNSTMGIQAHTYMSYEKALAYLSNIYGAAPQDEDEECVIWEVSGPMDEIEMEEWSEHIMNEAEKEELQESPQEDDTYDEEVIWHSQK